MGRITIAIFTCLFFSVFDRSCVSAEDVLTVEQLLKHATKIDTSNNNYRSIEIKGYHAFDRIRPLAFHIVYEQPNRYAIALFDKKDGMPLVFFDDKQVLAYNPTVQGILYAPEQSIFV